MLVEVQSQSTSKKKKEKPYNKHLINLVCSIRTVSYGPLFIPHGPSASRLGHNNGKNSGP